MCVFLLAMFMGADGVVEAPQTSIGALWTTSSQKIISPDCPGTIRYLSIEVGIDRHRRSLSVRVCVFLLAMATTDVESSFVALHSGSPALSAGHGVSGYTSYSNKTAIGSSSGSAASCIGRSRRKLR